MATRRQKISSKRNIKKAQRVWDRSHYSLREGNIPKTLATDKDETFRLVLGSVGACTTARKTANNIRKLGYKARVKELTTEKGDKCAVYKGPKRKKQTRVKAGTGPKGQHHAGYSKKLSGWKGYGQREKGGLGRGR